MSIARMWSCVVVCCGVLGASVAHGDVVLLANGRQMEALTTADRGTNLALITAAGEVVIPRQSIRSHVRRGDELVAYLKKQMAAGNAKLVSKWQGQLPDTLTDAQRREVASLGSAAQQAQANASQGAAARDDEAIVKQAALILARDGWRDQKMYLESALTTSTVLPKTKAAFLDMIEANMLADAREAAKVASMIDPMSLVEDDTKLLERMKSIRTKADQVVRRAGGTGGMAPRP